MNYHYHWVFYILAALSLVLGQIGLVGCLLLGFNKRFCNKFKTTRPAWFFFTCGLLGIAVYMFAVLKGNL